LVDLLGSFDSQDDTTVFLVVHRAKETPHLKTIIERTSKLEVCEPDDREPMRANCLYLAQPDCHMILGENHIHVRHGRSWATPPKECVHQACLMTNPSRSFYNLLRVAETDGVYLHRPGTERINPLLVAQTQAEYDRWTAEDPARHREAFAFYRRMTKMLAEEGVMLVAGSDAGIFTNVPGVSLIEELELLEGAASAGRKCCRPRP